MVLSTHYDCVPPFFQSRVENGRIHGRGACDAKGILAAQIAASERLRADGETRGGLLFGGFEHDPVSFDPDDLASGMAALTLDEAPLTRMAEGVADVYPDVRDAGIAEVIGGLPTMTPDGFHITAKCRNYLQPLISGEAFPPFENGLPKYVRLKNAAVKKKT